MSTSPGTGKLSTAERPREPSREKRLLARQGGPAGRTVHRRRGSQPPAHASPPQPLEVVNNRIYSRKEQKKAKKIGIAIPIVFLLSFVFFSFVSAIVLLPFYSFRIRIGIVSLLARTKAAALLIFPASTPFWRLHGPGRDVILNKVLLVRSIWPLNNMS